MNPFVYHRTIDSFDFEEFKDQIKTGDFNGDGNLDFVVARWNLDFGTTPAPLQLYLGDGAGQFYDATEDIFLGETPYVNFVARMLVEDFNQDGVSDLFCVDTGIDKEPFSGGQNRLFISAGGYLVDSTDELPQKLKNNHGASVGDINSDGNLDILVNALMSDGNYLLLGSENSYIPSPELLPELSIASPWIAGKVTPNTHTASALIDLNNDGYVDMILGRWDSLVSTERSQIYLNDGGKGFAMSSPIDLPPSAVEDEIVLDIKAIDLNGDDLPDLAISITNGGDRSSFYRTPYLQLLTNIGDGAFRDETNIRFPQPITVNADRQDWYKSIEVVDLNRDGFHDIVLDNRFGGASKVLLNDGFGNFNTVFEKGPRQMVAVGDVDNDGLPDLILSSETAKDAFFVYLNTLENRHIYKAKFGGEGLHGSEQADKFITGGGDDKFVGNGGTDTVFYNGNIDEYVIKVAETVQVRDSVIARDGSDTLVNVERLDFTDANLALDIDGVAGQAYRIYKAAFDRAPDLTGLGYWISAMDNGAALTGVAGGFIASTEFQSRYGAVSDTDFIRLLYENVLDRQPDAGGYAFWQDAMGRGLGREGVLVEFSESPENKSNVAGLIANGIEYTPFIS